MRRLPSPYSPAVGVSISLTILHPGGAQNPLSCQCHNAETYRLQRCTGARADAGR